MSDAVEQSVESNWGADTPHGQHTLLNHRALEKFISPDTGGVTLTLSTAKNVRESKVTQNLQNTGLGLKGQRGLAEQWSTGMFLLDHQNSYFLYCCCCWCVCVCAYNPELGGRSSVNLLPMKSNPVFFQPLLGTNTSAALRFRLS